MNALITEKDRLYYFYIILNMSKEETCKAMGYTLKRIPKGTIKQNFSRFTLDKKLAEYKIKQSQQQRHFNYKKSVYLKYGVDNTTKLISTQYKMQNSCLKKYGTTNVYSSEYCKNKIRNTMLHRYGVIAYTKTYEYLQKTKQTDLKKYGVEYHINAPIIRNKIKKTLIIKYDVDNPSKNKDIIKKIFEKRKQNGTMVSSKEEEDIFKLLIIKFKEVKRQYKSKRYPFSCDFYIPTLDLYIEYQGHWSHGKRNKEILGPYNSKNLYHKQVLKEWKTKAQNMATYKSAIEVWTKCDPLKRKIASNNNLNWLEFFDMNAFMLWYNSL